MGDEIVTKAVEEGVAPLSPSSEFRARDETAYLDFKAKHSRVDPEIFMRVEQIGIAIDSALAGSSSTQMRRAIVETISYNLMRQYDASVLTVVFGLLAEHWIHGDLIREMLIP